MRLLLTTIFLAATGCDSYLSTQLHLTEQARRGLELCRQAQQEGRAQADQLHDLRRRQLDEAFDADVREQVDFTADWIFEARKVYAAAIDALARQRAASAAADHAQTRNLDAIDAAPDRLQRLQQAQLELLRSPEPR